MLVRRPPDSTAPREVSSAGVPVARPILVGVPRESADLRSARLGEPLSEMLGAATGAEALAILDADGVDLLEWREAALEDAVAACRDARVRGHPRAHVNRVC